MAETAPFGEAALRALRDQQLFAPYFRPAESWAAWEAVLRVLFGLALSAEDLALLERCAGRKQAFSGALTEAWLLCGRRSGKSRILALIAVILACFKDYSRLVSAGERVVIMVLAVDRDQAQVIFGYARALIADTPMLRSLLEHETAESLELSNGVSIEVHTSSYKSVRGRTLAAALCDEIAFWRSDESRNPGTAVIAALRPSLGSIPDALLLCASSTYDRSGPAYEAFDKYHGNADSDVLVWRAPTRLMNPAFRQSVIDKAYAQDPLSAAAEYDSEFRSDVAAAFPDELIDACVCRGRKSLPYVAGMRYLAFCDPSGGQHDSMVLGISHRDRERDRVLLDRLVVAKAPFEPASVTADFAQVLAAYGVHKVVGDRYASQWVVSAFSKQGITYVASELDKSAIYRECIPAFSAGRVELLEDSRLLLELRQLERRPGRNGRADQIDHRPGGRDDIANAACGALQLAAAKRSLRISESLLNGGGLGVDEPGWPPGWDVQAADAQPRAALSPEQRYSPEQYAKLFGVDPPET